ncbi:coronin-2B isoform X3 [Cephus cinctus]|uniref:Coronin n=1 Tax=Cephus cinctus TaxID=211228 RepID=A0AAJ7RC57_CEPCN|nr:coronin-2B isoform X3 [Cephus cinctus]XP_015589489.1 coronin-2B isoform X3 [Cephus cinctus]XP_024938182.1 coronin-2B isoform X3 [Cephus cinctus]XP_024938183.1 coronin-2B isoform X3 [Cephus cinctus]XP_024938184.1 coronin-2B isoform X3 [Cephus cinctus]XP_024938185.1 coronin-2B isoform X3 [Cephus cinctus]XP_024938186.1 coronin-2B isoform X3 [Cephus cinctus]XP_024938187.1 coronin-2B isoform X3 [Cephus cinctus]
MTNDKHPDVHTARVFPAGTRVPSSWFRGVRSSKFRHVYGVPAKRERCYDNIKITKNAHDSQFCAVNPKFLAVVTEVAGGGAFLVLPLDNTGRLDFNASRVTGHTGPVLDIKWNPFNDNVIASCSDDCTVKLWHIPDGGLSRNLTDWLVELQGHKRRVAYLEWHPVAENVLFSAGFDHLVIVWDINRGEAVSVIDRHPNVIYSMSLNRDGSLLATTCKDKKLRVFEPRSGIVVSEGVCHAGTKASKVVFLGGSGRLLTTGFSRHSDRQYAIWSQHDLSMPLTCETIDSSSGIVFPYYDNDTNMVFLAGKGDGNIRYYEVANEAPWLHYLSQFISGNPQRGLGIMPKRGVNTSICEVYRFYKLHATRGMCEPISMIVPRKSDQFQEDLYPDTIGTTPALSAKDWISGMNSPPILISLKTGALSTGGSITTHKPRVYKPAQMPPATDLNTKKKFAFLSTETVPDYRPVELHDMSEKSQKTSSNQSTKFHELQQKFGSAGLQTPRCSTKIYELVSKFGSYTHYNKKSNIVTTTLNDNKVLETVDIPNNEAELRVAFARQTDELRLVRRQLANSQLRVKELEEQVRKLQSH